MLYLKIFVYLCSRKFYVMKCILLIRVSTEKQSYSEQEKELFSLAMSSGYAKQDIIPVRNKESAIKLDEEERSGLTEMKALIETGEYDCVFAWEISRIARRKKILFSILEYLQKKKIQLIIKEPRIRLLKDDGEIDEGAETVFTLFAQIAESEMRNKAARFDRARREGYEKGKYMGGKYLRGYTVNDKGYWEVDPEGARFVKMVFDLYNSGEYSMSELAKELKSRGYFKDLTITSTKAEILRMLRNEAYIGKRINNNVYPPIIDSDTWDKCRLRREENKCRPKSRLNALLTPLIRCKCQASYTLNVHDGSYTCRVKHNGVEKGIQHSPDIHASVIESLAWHIALKELQSDLKKNRTDAIRYYNTEKTNLLQKAEYSKQQIKAIQSRRSQLDTAYYVEARFSKEKYDELAAKQNDMIKEEQDNLRKYRKAISDIDAQIEAKESFDEMMKHRLEDYEELQEGTDFDTMRKIVKRYIVEINVWPVEGMKPKPFWKRVKIKTTNDEANRKKADELRAHGKNAIALDYDNEFLIDTLRHIVYYGNQPDEIVPYIFMNRQPRRRKDNRKRRKRNTTNAQTTTNKTQI